MELPAGRGKAEHSRHGETAGAAGDRRKGMRAPRAMVSAAHRLDGRFVAVRPTRSLLYE